jgi:ATP-dependent DNA helicase RecG
LDLLLVQVVVNSLPKLHQVKNRGLKFQKLNLVKWIKSGEIAITVGTHALIAKSIDFHDLGLVIIDEQHRFRY